MTKKPFLAVCGAGFWGKNLVKHFRELGVLRGLCDKNADTLKSYAEMYPDFKITTSFEDILNDPSITAVAVAVPTMHHYEFSKQALLAGKHVFVEKPIALKVEHARELCVIARKKRLKLMVGHLLLYHPAVQKLKEIIQTKELGEIYYMYTQRLNLGQVRKDENALWSLAPHDVSVILELFPEKPISVSAYGYSYIQTHKGIEDVIFMNLNFKDGKAAHIHLSWLDPHKVRRITLVGSKKMVVFDDMTQADKIKIFDKGVDHSKDMANTRLVSSMVLRVGEVVAPCIDNIEPLRLECLHFIDCIEKNKEPHSNGENGLAVLKILHAASKSLELGGKSVKL